MSLAIYAAPFDNNSNTTNNNENLINTKKQAHNRTQKRFSKENFNSEKVNSVLQSIHDHSNVEDEEEGPNLGDFNPPPKPQSSGVQKTVTTEQMLNMSNNMSNENLKTTLGSQPRPLYDDSSANLDLNNFNKNYGDEQTAEEYYKRFVPNYNSTTQNRQYYTNNYNSKPTYTNTAPLTQNDILLQKLNYMIHLLEENQDEKTNHVTEEVILYSFLGIFIIFVVDSFARVGKYVR